MVWCHNEGRRTKVEEPLHLPHPYCHPQPDTSSCHNCPSALRVHLSDSIRFGGKEELGGDSCFDNNSFDLGHSDFRNAQVPQVQYEHVGVYRSGQQVCRPYQRGQCHLVGNLPPSLGQVWAWGVGAVGAFRSTRKPFSAVPDHVPSSVVLGPIVHLPEVGQREGQADF